MKADLAASIHARLAHASGARPTTPSVLTEAIRATFERRRTPFPPAMLLGLEDRFGEDALKRKQWSAFLAKIAWPHLLWA